MLSPLAATGASIPLLLLILKFLLPKRQKRPSRIPKHRERVLILGATSGIGRVIARQYAERGARVCIVGRREELVREVEEECRHVRAKEEEQDGVLGVKGDFADVGDMVHVREILTSKWGGLDTLILSAGVSALQPLLAVAGVEAQSGTPNLQMTTQEGIQRAADVSSAAIRGNYTGPLISAVTFIPTLTQASLSPSILLVSSLASVIPAPTRSIYASSKSASLLLFQSLAIEHPSISFSYILPSTIEGDFRASAVDQGPVRELNPNKHGLKREDVARRCILAVDRQEGTVFLPWSMRLAHLLYWVAPRLVNHFASKKYNFSA